MMLGVFFAEWKQNNYFKDKIKKTLWKTFNKKLPDFLREITIKNLTVNQKNCPFYINFFLKKINKIDKG